jgi:D-alanyl-lipoteichoic acid acyltransferase DltB (MBOAT superfamily)
VSFSNVEFAFFFPVVFLVYWLLPRRIGWQNAFLLAVSYLFYATWNPRLLPLILLATAVDYWAALRIDANRPAPGAGDTAEARAGRRRMRGALAVSLVYNVGQLAFFKYFGFFAESLNGLLGAMGLPSSLPVLRLVLPVGISFYTLQKMAYVLDVYNGAQQPCRSKLTFATFVAFFPQLVAGPIPRGQDLLPQFGAPRRPSPDQWRAGAGAFLLGFVKKAYAAEYLAQFVVDPVFSAPERYSAAGHWIALVGYAAQIFCDFSGYSDMAIGSARLLGIELPENFRFPFLSRSLREMWQRWHITLNSWLFEYLYGPLTTSRGWWRGRLDLGFIVVFLISGLWHGAAWTFILWGFLHGVGLVIHRRWDEFYRGLCRRDRSYVALRQSNGYGAASWGLTQFFFLLTLVPFRAPSAAAAGAFARALLGSAGTERPTVLSINIAVIGAFLIAYHVLALPIARKAWDRFVALPAPVRGFAYGLVVVYLMIFMPAASGTFIYANF